MALRVITGSANSGKTGVAYARARQVARGGGRVLILVPSEPDAARAMLEFARDAPVGLATRTLDGYLDRCWFLHGDGRLVVTSAQRLLLLAETVNHLRAESPGTLWDSRGVIGTLATLVQRAAEAPSVGHSGESASVPAELLRAASMYRVSLSSANLVEPAEAYRFAVDSLSRSDVPDLIVVNRITGLTAAQERLVIGAARLTEVLVCLTHHSMVPATAGAFALVSRLVAQGSGEQPPESRHTLPLELAAIERSLGGPPPRPSVSDGALILSEAYGDSAEAAGIVLQILDAYAEGVAPERIAVVLRDPASHMDALLRALREAGIDAEWDGQVPFTRSGLGRALLAALQFVQCDHAARVDLLRTPYVPVSDALLDALDARVRRSGSVSSRRMEALCGEMDPQAGEYLRALRLAQAAVGGPAGPQRWHRLVTDMLGNAWRMECSSEHELLLDAGAARVLLQVIDGASRLGMSGVQTDIVPALMVASITLTSREEPGRVQVMSAERARSRRFDCVIIGGLTHPGFPRTSRDDALSSPSVARAFSAVGIDVVGRGGLEQERLLFYQVATRARRRLVLSRQSHDAEGRPLRPSVFWDEVLDLYRAPEADGVPPAQEPARNVIRAGTQTARAPAPRVARRARHTIGGPAQTALSGREVFSATEIEAYLQCPFLWFVEHVIRPREIGVHVDAAAAGRLGHEIMYHFYDEFIDRTGAPRVSPETLSVARDVHRSVSDRLVRGVRTESVVDDVALRRAVIHTLRLVEADATILEGMAPIHREWTFGMDDDPEPFGGFALAGRVDRIDADETRLVVTDYKRGAPGPERCGARFATEGLVQLPLYAAVASRRLDRSIAGGVYRSGACPKPRGFIHSDVADRAFVSTDIFEADAIETLVADAIRRSGEAIEGIRAGRIAADPLGGACPGYCPARGFCAEGRRAGG